MGLLGALRARLSQRRWCPSIEASGTGISVHFPATWRRAKRTARYAWTEIARIDAYKRDLFATDLICWLVTLRDDRVVELHEEQRGWDALVTEAEERLPGFPARDEWWPKVAHPPFEYCRRTLYGDAV